MDEEASPPLPSVQHCPDQQQSQCWLPLPVVHPLTHVAWQALRAVPCHEAWVELLQRHEASLKLPAGCLCRWWCCLLHASLLHPLPHLAHRLPLLLLLSLQWL